MIWRVLGITPKSLVPCQVKPHCIKSRDVKWLVGIAAECHSRLLTGESSQPWAGRMRATLLVLENTSRLPYRERVGAVLEGASLRWEGKPFTLSCSVLDYGKAPTRGPLLCPA